MNMIFGSFITYFTGYKPHFESKIKKNGPGNLNLSVVYAMA